jgi:cyclase
MQEIRPNIFYEDRYAGVTLGALILPRGIILLDAPLRAEDSLAWNTSILSRSGKDTDSSGKEACSDHMLVYLDAHPDRTIGARILETTGQIPFIVAHHDTARGFENRPTIFKGQNADSGAEWEACDDVVSTRWALPDLTFFGSICLYWDRPTNGKKNNTANAFPTQVILEHHPGSAAGAIWVHLPQEKVLFVGDAVLTNQPPFLENANIPEWLRSLTELVDRAQQGYTIVSGRGGLVTEGHVRSQAKYLERIQQLLVGFSKKHTPQLDVDSFMPDLLDRLDFPSERKSLYTLRLRFGVQHYYQRHFHGEGGPA